MLTVLAIAVAVGWGILLVAPPWPWRNLHLLEPGSPGTADLGDVTVLIPARDEASTLPRTLAALEAQGRGLGVVLVDDQSGDGTASVARRAMPGALRIVAGAPVPPGWSGKVWAQHQGEALLDRPFTLLLDADIELAPGMVAALRRKALAGDLALVSIMARLGTDSAWERLLVPPFIHFFKLLYPFAWSNDPRRRLAAAAGGCVLLRTGVLRQVGGFRAMHDAIIDDCTLARRFKDAGARTWIGQSRGVVSRRPYTAPGDIWNMVARTAFTQLGYSTAMLLGCTALMLLMFFVPFAALAAGGAGTVAGLVALTIMVIVFIPTVRFLDLSPVWALTLPVASAGYLLMTWTSAVRYWGGERSAWRGRRYARGGVGADDV